MEVFFAIYYARQIIQNINWPAQEKKMFLPGVPHPKAALIVVEFKLFVSLRIINGAWIDGSEAKEKKLREVKKNLLKSKFFFDWTLGQLCC